MSWRYGASYIQESGPADTTAPIIDTPLATDVTASSADLSFNTDEGIGTGYYYVSTSSIKPTEVDLINGTGSVVFGSKSVTAVGTTTFADVSGLTKLSDYYAHFLHRDGAGNLSNIVSSDKFTTLDDVIAPIIDTPDVTDITTTSADLSFYTDEGNGTGHFYVSTTSIAPTEPDLINGTGSVVFGSKAVTSVGSVEFNDVSGLAEFTDYYVHFLQEDSAGNISNIVSSTVFTTLDDVIAPIIDTPAVTDINSNTADLSFNTDKGNGVGHYYVSTSSIKPAEEDLLDGTGSVVFGNKSVTAIGTVTFNDVTGLTKLSDYYAHFLHVDAVGNPSNIISTVKFTTLGSGPLLSYLTVYSGYFDPHNSARVGVFTDTSGGHIYGYIYDSPAEPSLTDLVSGEGSESLVDYVPGRNGTQALPFIGRVTAGVPRYVYVVHKDANGVFSNVLTKQFSTTPYTNTPIVLSAPEITVPDLTKLEFNVTTDKPTKVLHAVITDIAGQPEHNEELVGLVSYQGYQVDGLYTFGPVDVTGLAPENTPLYVRFVGSDDESQYSNILITDQIGAGGVDVTELAISDVSSKGTIESVSSNIELSISINDLSSKGALDDVTLDYIYDLVLSDTNSVPVVSNVAIVSDYTLSISNIAASPSIGSTKIESTIELDSRNISSIGSIDNVAIHLNILSAVVDVFGSSKVDNTKITIDRNLVTQVPLSTGSIPSLSIVVDNDLVVLNTFSSGVVDDIGITTDRNLSAETIESTGSINQLLVTTNINLSIDNTASSSNTITSVSLSGSGLTVADVKSIGAVDSLGISVGLNASIEPTSSQNEIQNTKISITNLLDVGDIDGINNLDVVSVSITNDLLTQNIIGTDRVDSVELGIILDLSIDTISSNNFIDSLFVTSFSLSIGSISGVSSIDPTTISIDNNIILKDVVSTGFIEDVLYSTELNLTISDLQNKGLIDDVSLEFVLQLNLNDVVSSGSINSVELITIILKAKLSLGVSNKKPISIGVINNKLISIGIKEG